MIKEVILDVLRRIRALARSKNENLPYLITIVICSGVFILALNGFVELTEELAEDDLTTFDDRVSGYIQSFRSAPLTSYFRFFTDLGDRYAYIALTLLLGAYFYVRNQSWKFVLQTVLVLLLATGSNVVLKSVIDRQRPAVEHLVSVNTLSYPSGHAMSAMAFYGFLIYLTVRYAVDKRLRLAIIAVLVWVILSVGISRIYLGVHYPSDVLAGFIGGLIWVTFCAVLFNLFDIWRYRRVSA